ncbi:hypothetical protein HaLaN_06684, partial [Haematococcus lacustris]
MRVYGALMWSLGKAA